MLADFPFIMSDWSVLRNVSFCGQVINYQWVRFCLIIEVGAVQKQVDMKQVDRSLLRNVSFCVCLCFGGKYAWICKYFVAGFYACLWWRKSKKKELSELELNLI